MQFFYALIFIFFIVPTAAANEPFEAEIFEARGLINSTSKIEITTPLVATVSQAQFIEGDSFNKGDVLISFNCAKYQAELEGAQALELAQQIELNSKQELYKHNAAGKNELELAKASAAKAQAQVNLQKAHMQDCKIIAPFAGRVAEVFVKQYEMPKKGTPIITILDSQNLELELVIPSHWLNWLDIGNEFSFIVDETGETHQAYITRLGAEIDPVSQTIKAFGKLHTQQTNTLAGMSGAATFTKTRKDISNEPSSNNLSPANQLSKVSAR